MFFCFLQWVLYISGIIVSAALVSVLGNQYEKQKKLFFLKIINN